MVILLQQSGIKNVISLLDEQCVAHVFHKLSFLSHLFTFIF